MARPREHQEAVNADSFVDIVASIVSIMLVMVVLVGVNIRRTSVDDLVAAAAAETTNDLVNELTRGESMRKDVLEVAQQVALVEQETQVKAAQREVLATAIAAMEHEIGQRRAKLGEVDRQRFDLANHLAASRQQLADLGRQREAIENAEAAPTVLCNFPTPISRTVDDHETHFQLRHGRIAPIPLDSLVQEFRADARRQVDKLRSRPSFTDTVGPVGGFRLRYTFVRRDATVDGSVASGAYAELERWELLPVDDDMGESIDAALGGRSEFRHAMGRCQPGQGALTIWVYTDSFAEFRRLREELYKLGYSVAARPLEMDDFIAGSPHGTKSSAQ